MLSLIVAGSCLLPLAARAQDAVLEGCRVANLQRADELLQGLSAARSKRSSFTLALKLTPIELQLKTLKAAPQGALGTVADCQRVTAQIEGERERLLRLLPDLQIAPAAVIAPAAAPVQNQAPVAVSAGTCRANNEQSRADLAQRFVHFMQLARVPWTGMAPYQSLGRRLSALNANMMASPGDCINHGALLAQSNSELQQLMAMESRAASQVGSGTVEPNLEGTMPLLSGPGGETCVAELRVALRDAQQDATRLSMTTPGGIARDQAQLLVNAVVQQQVDAFGRSPLSPQACEQSRRQAGDTRASVASLRNGDLQGAVRPLAAAQPVAAQPPPRPALAAAPSPQPQPATQPAEGNPLVECMTENRRVFIELERESNKLKAAGRQSPVPDMEMANYREGIRQPILIYCGALNGNLTTRLSQVRAVATVPPVAPAPALATAPATVQSAATATTPAPAPVATTAQRMNPPTPAPASPAPAALQSGVPARPAPVAPGLAVSAKPPPPAPTNNQRVPAAAAPPPSQTPASKALARTRQEDGVQK